MNNPELERLKGDEIAMRQELGIEGMRGNTCKCPFHADKTPSASIRRNKNGTWKFHCFVCDIDEDVIGVRSLLKKTKVGDELKALVPQETYRPPVRKAKEAPPRLFKSIQELEAAVIAWKGGPLQDTYIYRRPTSGEIDLIIIRVFDVEKQDKTFVQCRQVEGGFEMKKPEGISPLYNRTRVAASEVVLVVEGESCVHALAKVGVVATTSPGGAKAGADADWTPLRGKTVYLWPDNDEPKGEHVEGVGVTHMKAVAEILSNFPLPTKVYWIDHKKLDLPPAGDVVDFLAADPSLSDADKKLLVEAVIQDATPMGPSRELSQLFQDTIDGKRIVVPFPWDKLTQMTKALIPGTVTMLCGDPGTAKSLLLLQCVTFWVSMKFKPAVFELEDDRKFHLNRIVAQLEENASLTDPTWVKENGAAALRAVQDWQLCLDEIGACMWDAPDESPTLDALADWVYARAAEGTDVIAIDPITAAKTNDKPWEADLKFLMRVKSIARSYNTRVLLVTHPRKGKLAGKGFGDLAGGAAYDRFTHNILWLARFDSPRQVCVRVGYGTSTVNIGSSIQIRKARSGRGAGREVAFNFEPRGLRLSEIGLVEEPEENGGV